MDGLGWLLAEATGSSPLLLVPEQDWVGRGMGQAASGASVAGTPCQQLLESPLGSKANPFPASMETSLKTRLLGPTVVYPEDFSAARENSCLGLHRGSSESSLRALQLFLKQHPGGWRRGTSRGQTLQEDHWTWGISGNFSVSSRCPIYSLHRSGFRP